MKECIPLLTTRERPRYLFLGCSQRQTFQAAQYIVLLQPADLGQRVIRVCLGFGGITRTLSRRATNSIELNSGSRHRTEWPQLGKWGPISFRRSVPSQLYWLACLRCRFIPSWGRCS